MPPKKPVNRRLSLATTPKKTSLITNFFTPGKKFSQQETPKSLLRKVYDKPKSRIGLVPLLIPKDEIIEISDDDEGLFNSQQENQVNQQVFRKLELHETPRKKFSSLLNSPATGLKTLSPKSSKSKVVKKSPGTKRKRVPKIAPDYKIVQGTTFAVDAFQFGSIPKVSHYFLTHFHADHYIGLTKKFPHPIFCGRVTGSLVRKFIGDALDLRVVDINSPVIVEDVEITALDANHCPGALMYVFRLKSGRCVLHTGDFRACPDMESEPFFWNNSIHTIYLDTTYLKVQYSFKPQAEALDDVIRYVEESQQKNPGARILYICGSYFIGKERVWLRIAEYFSYKVYVEEKRRSALELLESEEYTKYLESDPENANIHVLPMGDIGYHSLEEYSQKFLGIFDVFVSFEPSGWRHGKIKQYKFNSRINLVNVEYSEHSSFEELERFVRFLQPEEVISTVPIGRDLHETCDIPKNWLNAGVKPKSRNLQLSITNFLNEKNQKSIAYPKDLDACLFYD